jgi:hypothetical protein
MMSKILFAVALPLIVGPPANAATTELPSEMTGYWSPLGYGHELDPHNWPGAMQRIAEPNYEWEVSQDQWLMWDGICKIHDVKQLGEMDYEVRATCGLIKGDKPPYTEMETNTEYASITEERYQFTLCGDTLNIRELKDQPAEPDRCVQS